MTHRGCGWYIRAVAYRRTKTTQFNLRLTPDELEAFRRGADQLGVSVSKLLIDATLDKIERERLDFKGTLRRMIEKGQV